MEHSADIVLRRDQRNQHHHFPHLHFATTDVPVELYPLAFCVGVAGLGGVAALGRQSESLRLLQYPFQVC